MMTVCRYEQGGTDVGRRRPLSRLVKDGAEGPAYRRIEAHLTALIAQGQGRTEPLPAEPELAAEFGVSRMTARQAYQRLVSSGVVVRYRGLGSFVTGHHVEELPVEGAPDFDAWIVRGERGAGRRVLKRAVITAPADVARTFELPAAGKVLHVQVLRFKNGVPCLDTRFVRASLRGALTRERLEKASLLQSIVEEGYEVAEGEISIDAHRASGEEASMLGIKIGDPVLERRVAFRDRSGRCIVFGNSRYPGGDAYTFRVNFYRARGERANRSAGALGDD